MISQEVVESSRSPRQKSRRCSRLTASSVLLVEECGVARRVVGGSASARGTKDDVEVEEEASSSFLVDYL